MFSRLGDEELIQAKMQKIAKIDIQMCPSKRANPKVEQREVSQYARKKFDGECSISRLERALRERAGINRVSKLPFSAPGSQRGEQRSAARSF